MSFRIRGQNATSGIGVADHSKDAFLELKRKKSYRYVIFKIDEKKKEVVVEKKKEVVVEKKKEVVVEKKKEVVVEKKKEVVVEKIGDPAESYEDFVASLPENDCRYAVFDFDFVTSDNCQKSKIFFIAWSPSTSRVRAKMLYAASKEWFKRELDGIHYEIQATDPTEMDLDVIKDRAN